MRCSEKELEKHFEAMKEGLKKKYMADAKHFYEQRMKAMKLMKVESVKAKEMVHKAAEQLKQGHYRDGPEEERRRGKGPKTFIWILAVLAFVGLGYYCLRVYRAKQNQNIVR